MSDLYIEATPDLLDGWTGPVLLEERGTPNWIPGAVVDGKHVMAWIGPVGFYDVVTDRVPRLRLDLSRVECRDRVGRCMAARVGYPTSNGLSWWAWCGGPGGWALGSGPDASADCLVFPRQWPLALLDGQRQMWREVPALAALDPSDDTRLPDGSRRVDALALAACWRALVAEVPRGR